LVHLEQDDHEPATDFQDYRPLPDAINDLNQAAYPLTAYFDREK
jgi:hypothetical protein